MINLKLSREVLKLSFFFLVMFRRKKSQRFLLLHSPITNQTTLYKQFKRYNEVPVDNRSEQVFYCNKKIHFIIKLNSLFYVWIAVLMFHAYVYIWWKQYVTRNYSNIISCKLWNKLLVLYEYQLRDYRKNSQRWNKYRSLCNVLRTFILQHTSFILINNSLSLHHFEAYVNFIILRNIGYGNKKKKLQ